MCCTSGGGFLLTILVSVPLNKSLQVYPTALTDSRTGYEDSWNFWNGVRAAFSSPTFLVLIVLCLIRPARQMTPTRARQTFILEA